MKSVTDVNVIKACILGHAVGDALGLPVEFSRREELDKDPVTDMRGYGSFNMPAGAWSDDTSLTLCGLEALSRKEFEWDAVMQNAALWLYENGFTPTGYTFDVGRTCELAIRGYHSGLSYDNCGLSGEQDNGNGSLMRIIPFALYAPDDAEFIETASALTHAHKRSKIACVIYSFILKNLVLTREKETYYDGIIEAKEYYKDDAEWQHFEPLLDIENRERSSIVSSGYSVTTLEAALWCLLTTDSYRDCVLKAVNLGRDTDTIAAVAGGLAGALYGLDGIPAHWLDALLRREWIESLCEKAGNRWKMNMN